ncbi:MAG: hypothetical protein ACPG77_14015 [Nannocystaceae bacterium]
MSQGHQTVVSFDLGGANQRVVLVGQGSVHPTAVSRGSFDLAGVNQRVVFGQGVGNQRGLREPMPAEDLKRGLGRRSREKDSSRPSAVHSWRLVSPVRGANQGLAKVTSLGCVG